VKAWILVGIVVAATVAGDALQSFEMKRQGEVHIRGGRLGSVAAALATKKCLILAIFCMAVSFFAFITLLSQSDLSFAVPASAGSFVLETVLARFLLGEQVDFRRWVGAALVAGGVALLAV
jgi:drug/metabolite transporter (DMT)-like permease